jgi:hypothetical protein
MYRENIDFQGKAIALRSAQGPNETTFIGGDDISEPVITFKSGEGSSSIVDGFTITGGKFTTSDKYTPYGGGIYIQNSSPQIENCIITGNYAQQDGGGIFCHSSAALPEIFHTIFSDNHADQGRGGGLCVLYGSPLLFDCLFYTNVAQQGGAIYASYGASPLVSNCTISGNTAAVAGGALCALEASFTIENSIVSGNTAPAGHEAFLDLDSALKTHDASISLSHVDLEGGVAAIGIGNECNSSDPAKCTIDPATDPLDPNDPILKKVDPKFAQGPKGPFYLSHEGVDDQTTTSPCVDQGSVSAIDIGLNTRTTSTNQAVDEGSVDLGFHYPVVTAAP